MTTATDRKHGPGRLGRPSLLTGALLLLLVVSAVRARAGGVRIDLSNDFLTSNVLDDDLYTFGLEFTYNFGRYDLSLVENAFTDSAHNLRFDETYLSASREFRPFSGWHPHFRVGVLRVGRGLFGQRFQNGLHRLVGDKKVELPYLEGSHLYPALGLGFWRQHLLRGNLSVLPKIELSSSFGFKSSAVVSVEAIWQPLPTFWLGVAVGGRYSDTAFAPLEPWIADTGPVTEISVGLPNNMVFSWNYNRFGTRFEHVSIDYRWTPGGRRRQPGPRLSRHS